MGGGVTLCGWNRVKAPVGDIPVCVSGANLWLNSEIIGFSKGESEVTPQPSFSGLASRREPSGSVQHVRWWTGAFCRAVVQATCTAFVFGIRSVSTRAQSLALGGGGGWAGSGGSGWAFLLSHSPNMHTRAILGDEL